MNQVQDDLKKLLDGMFESRKQKNIETFEQEFPILYQKQKERLSKCKDAKNFDLLSRQLAYYDYKEKLYDCIFSGVEIQVFDDKNPLYSMILEKIITGAFKDELDSVIRGSEGFSCCGDKSSFVTKRMLEFLKTGKRQDLQYFYSEKDDWCKKEDYGKLAYWCPEIFKTTDDVLLWYQKKIYIIDKINSLNPNTLVEMLTKKDV